MTADYSSLDADGCIIIRDAIDPAIYSEFETVIDELARLFLKKRGTACDASEAMTSLLKSGGDFRKALFPQLKNLRVLQDLEQHVTAFLEASGFMDWAAMGAPSVHRILKADVPGEGKYLLPMHQDYNTPVHRGWRAWVPLRHACPENGTMRFARGSHRHGFLQHDTSDPERPRIASEIVPEEACEVLDLPAGGIFLFHPLLVHASVPATSDRMKYALIVNFWDLATLADPEDADDPVNARVEMGRHRDLVRGDRDPVVRRTGQPAAS